MTSFIWPLRKDVLHQSAQWRRSETHPGVDFQIRCISLGERIALAERLRELCARSEFLRAGDSGEQLEAALGEMQLKRAYLEWGLLKVRGLRIDGKRCTPESLIAAGPEQLTEEVLAAIQSEFGLTETERKNS